MPVTSLRIGRITELSFMNYRVDLRIKGSLVPSSIMVSLMKIALYLFTANSIGYFVVGVSQGR